MNKLTAEECRERIKYIRQMISNDTSKLSRGGQCQLQALEIALQVLEAEPLADVVAWNHPSEERKCSFQLRRFDLTPGPLFMLAPQPTTDTYRQIENDGWIEWGGGECPVADSFKVEVKYRSVYDDYEDYADRFAWNHDGAYDDIIAYRVIENDGREG